jgi:8-oxo-dGTP diphosphatase
MRPLLGVSACVWRNDKVLIVQRSKPPFEGLWSLPGGHVEWGESLRAAAARELMEETGVEAELRDLVDVFDAIRRRGEVVEVHYAIVCFGGRWLRGEATAQDDALAVRWVRLGELAQLAMTEGTAAIIGKAGELVRS